MNTPVQPGSRKERRTTLALWLTFAWIVLMGTAHYHLLLTGHDNGIDITFMLGGIAGIARNLGLFIQGNVAVHKAKPNGEPKP